MVTNYLTPFSFSGGGDKTDAQTSSSLSANERLVATELNAMRDKINELVTRVNESSGYASYTDTTYVNAGSAFTVVSGAPRVLPNNALGGVVTQLPQHLNGFYSPASLKFDALTADFTAGQTVTGGTSGASAVIQEFRKSGTVGTLFLKAITGTFTDNETITDGAGGSATANGSNGSGLLYGGLYDGVSIMIYCKAIPSAANQYVDMYIDIGGSIAPLYSETKDFPRGAGIEHGLKFTVPAGYNYDTWYVNGGIVYIESNADLDIYGINFNYAITHRGLSFS